MKKNVLIATLIVILSSLSVHARKSDGTRNIFIPMGLDEGIVSYIENSAQGKFDGLMLNLKKDLSVEQISVILDYYYIKVQLCIDRLMNKNTVKTADGNAYRKKNAEIDRNGNISITEDEKSSCRYIYDPSHPDAIKEGPYKGYVPYPDIWVDSELDSMKLYEDLYNIFAAYAQKNIEGLTVEKIDLAHTYRIIFKLGRFDGKADEGDSGMSLFKGNAE